MRRSRNTGLTYSRAHTALRDHCAHTGFLNAVSNVYLILASFQSLMPPPKWHTSDQDRLSSLIQAARLCIRDEPARYAPRLNSAYEMAHWTLIFDRMYEDWISQGSGMFVQLFSYVLKPTPQEPNWPRASSQQALLSVAGDYQSRPCDGLGSGNLLF